jgi:hypothetical protein
MGLMGYEGYMNKVKQGQMGEIQIIKEIFHPQTKAVDDSDIEESKENNQLLVPNSEFKPGRRGGILQQTNYKAEAEAEVYYSRYWRRAFQSQQGVLLAIPGHTFRKDDKFLRYKRYP